MAFEVMRLEENQQEPLEKPKPLPQSSSTDTSRDQAFTNERLLKSFHGFRCLRRHESTDSKFIRGFVCICSDLVLSLGYRFNLIIIVPPTKTCCPLKGAGGLNKPSQTPPFDVHLNRFISTSSVGLAKQPPSGRRR